MGSGSSEGKSFKLPQDLTQETLETPELQAFRDFNPRVPQLRPTLARKFGTEHNAALDGTYGATSQVERLAGTDEAMANATNQEAQGVSEGVNLGTATRMAQLQSLANLTKKTRSYGYGSQAPQATGGGAGAAALGAAGTVGSAILKAFFPV
jgi:hypothetical protein